MWTRPSPEDDSLTDQIAGAGATGAPATRLLDEWATALAADDSGDPIGQKLAATRPEGADNTCFDLEGEVVASGGDIYDDTGPCTDPYPVGDDPRTAAGAPLANDIVEVHLAPRGRCHRGWQLRGGTHRCPGRTTAGRLPRTASVTGPFPVLARSPSVIPGRPSAAEMALPKALIPRAVILTSCGPPSALGRCRRCSRDCSVRCRILGQAPMC